KRMLGRIWSTVTQMLDRSCLLAESLYPAVSVMEHAYARPLTITFQVMEAPCFSGFASMTLLPRIDGGTGTSLRRPSTRRDVGRVARILSARRRSGHRDGARNDTEHAEG